MTKLWTLGTAAMLLVSSQSAVARPDCAGQVEIRRVDVVRVEKNGALILHDGRAVHLEGIRLPGGAADKAPQFLADQARAALTELTVGHELDFAAVPPKEDRYDRVRAQVFDGDSWLQREMVKRGLARVSISPDRTECASELYATEDAARQARSGIWSSSAYAVRSAPSVTGDIGTFQLVEGRVLAAYMQNGKAWLDFGNARGTFSAFIAQDDLKTYREMGVDPRAYEGKTILVRGIVQEMSGPAIAVANPIQVEVLGAK
jgi:endonuclease YncB( thermonuclease family)